MHFKTPCKCTYVRSPLPPYRSGGGVSGCNYTYHAKSKRKCNQNIKHIMNMPADKHTPYVCIGIQWYTCMYTCMYTCVFVHVYVQVYVQVYV